jgi:hypothetical protein
MLAEKMPGVGTPHCTTKASVMGAVVAQLGEPKVEASLCTVQVRTPMQAEETTPMLRFEWQDE